MRRRTRLSNPSGGILYSHSTTELAKTPRSAVIHDVRGYYRILSLDPNCSMDDIRRRGREMAKTLHPDMGGDVEEFLKVQEVLAVLLDSNSRRAYDAFDAFALYLSPLDISDMVGGARIRGDVRSVEEILESSGVRVVASKTPTFSPQDGTANWSYLFNEAVEETDQRMTNLRLWHDEIMQAAWSMKWKSAVRVGIAAITTRFEVERSWGQTIFWLGTDTVPTQQDADVAVLYAATHC